MNYLSDYINDAQTELFNKVGAFFAFSNKQLEEKIKQGVKYANMGAGLICPVENAKELTSGLSNIQDKGIAKDIAENGIKAIIKRELYNHECYYTGDISDAIDVLEQYDITPEQIIEVFNLGEPE